MARIEDILRRNVTEQRDETAVVCGERRCSWSVLEERSLKLAAALRADALRPGDRVAFLAPNRLEWAEALFGIVRAGAVFVPVNARLAPPEIDHVLRHSGARAIIFDPSFREAIESIRGNLPDLTVALELDPPQQGGGASYEEAIRGAGPQVPSDVDVSDDDLAVIAYTSGTTGLPKGAMWSHRIATEAAARSPYTSGLGAGSCCLLPLPLFAGGALAWLLSAFHARSRVVVLSFDPDAVFDAIEKERVECMVSVPAVLRVLAELPGAEKRDRSSLKRIVYGGAPMPKELLGRLVEFFQCDFIQGYGMTETMITGTLLGAEEHLAGDDPVARRRLDSAGRAIEGVDVRVVDEEGRDVSLDGAVGEVIIRSFGCMLGYWKDPEATKEALRDGWYHTGDMATIDGDGYVTICDRKNDMIISGGLNVYPAEVEAVLNRHPAVLEAAVIAVPSERWGEEVQALVRTRPGSDASAQAILALCRERLADYKAPKAIEFVKQPLPRNVLGKVLRRQLREPYWQGSTRRIG